MLEYSGRTWPEEKSQAQKQSDGSSERSGHVQRQSAATCVCNHVRHGQTPQWTNLRV